MPDTGPDLGDAGADAFDADGTDADDAGDSATDVGLDSGDGDVADMGPDVDPGPPCAGPPGLYREGGCILLADGVREFTPRYRLWSDGTTKDRFLLIPEGRLIDTRDPDNWIFPVGTRAWKTFSLDALRIETRLFEKTTEGSGASSWTLRTFAWNEEQNEVTEVTEGVVDALGTTHDIPATTTCVRCHSLNGRRDLLSGFSAIQLNHEGSATNLVGLEAEELLSDVILPEEAVIPGDPVVSEALGYLHANCGNCHGDAVGPAPSGLRMWVNVGRATPEDTDTYVTAVNVESVRTFGDATLRVAGGDPENSVLFHRIGVRDALGDESGAQMPPLASDILHPPGLDWVQAWIESLPAAPPPDE